MTQTLPNGSAIRVMIDGDLIGLQRGATFEETTAEIDTSSKDAREMTVIGGRYASSVSLDALYVPADNGYERLKAAMRNGSLVTVIREQNDDVLESAAALVTSLSEAAPDADAATVAATLRISGAWVAGS